jgi:hypothetical protein
VTLAHLGPVPVEELLALAPVAWLTLRGRLPLVSRRWRRRAV